MSRGKPIQKYASVIKRSSPHRKLYKKKSTKFIMITQIANIVEFTNDVS